jgi:hypothetical protein
MITFYTRNIRQTVNQELFLRVISPKLHYEKVLMSHAAESKVPQAWHCPSHADNDKIRYATVVKSMKNQSVQSLHVLEITHPYMREVNHCCSQLPVHDKTLISISILFNIKGTHSLNVWDVFLNELQVVLGTFVLIKCGIDAFQIVPALF